MKFIIISILNIMSYIISDKFTLPIRYKNHRYMTTIKIGMDYQEIEVLLDSEYSSSNLPILSNNLNSIQRFNKDNKENPNIYDPSTSLTSCIIDSNIYLLILEYTLEDKLILTNDVHIDRFKFNTIKSKLTKGTPSLSISRNQGPDHLMTNLLQSSIIEYNIIGLYMNKHTNKGLMTVGNYDSFLAGKGKDINWINQDCNSEFWEIPINSINKFRLDTIGNHKVKISTSRDHFNLNENIINDKEFHKSIAKSGECKLIPDDLILECKCDSLDDMKELKILIEREYEISLKNVAYSEFINGRCVTFFKSASNNGFMFVGNKFLINFYLILYKNSNDNVGLINLDDNTTRITKQSGKFRRRR